MKYQVTDQQLAQLEIQLAAASREILTANKALLEATRQVKDLRPKTIVETCDEVLRRLTSEIRSEAEIQKYHIRHGFREVGDKMAREANYWRMAAEFQSGQTGKHGWGRCPNTNLADIAGYFENCDAKKGNHGFQ